MDGFKSCGLIGSTSMSVDAGPYPEVLARFINDPRGGLGDREASLGSIRGDRWDYKQLYNCA